MLSLILLPLLQWTLPPPPVPLVFTCDIVGSDWMEEGVGGSTGVLSEGLLPASGCGVMADVSREHLMVWKSVL